MVEPTAPTIDGPMTPELAPSRTWTAWLLSLPSTSPSRAWASAGRRLVTAIGMSALFGAAIGLRSGGSSIAVHAAGLSLGVLAVCVLAVPAFAIGLALANASVDALMLAQASARAAATAGLVFAGLAPAAALFAVTVEDEITVTLVVAAGLALAGSLAMRSFIGELAPRLAEAHVRAAFLSRGAMPAFIVFGALLAARTWWVALPLLRGGL